MAGGSSVANWALVVGVGEYSSIPWEGDREFEIGRWTLPRSRDPGVPPVQQFILHATSPGLEATEKDEFGNERGAFTDALLGLRGEEAAKAWSWSRDCYDVRWERLVDFVKQRVEDEKHQVGSGPADDLLQHGPPLVVVHVDADRMRIFQYLLPRPGAGGDLEETRVAEYAQRLLLAGRPAAVEALARRLADRASDDPLGGCLGGYALLRLGDAAPDGARIADAVIAAAPELADGFVLRGEAWATTGDAERSRQAFADAMATGAPVFAEGLTLLVEGLRAASFDHPRAAIVRYLFQRHLRRSMWSGFVPRPRGGSPRLEADRLLVTGADTGFEA